MGSTSTQFSGALSTSSLFLMTALLLSLTPPTCLAEAQNSSNNSGPLICLVNFGFVSDLGYTFSFNKGHTEFFEWFGNEYPSIPFRTKIVPSGFYLPAADKAALGLRLVQEGCRVIVVQSSSVEIGDADIARRYPNVTVFRYNYAHLIRHVRVASNHALFGMRIDRSFYVSGQAAAKYARTCIGFVTAFETDFDCEQGTNGFILGVRSVNATIPVHVVTMQSWYRPDDEVHATDLLLSMGCEVVGRYIDSLSVNSAVSAWTAPSDASRTARLADTTKIRLTTSREPLRRPLSAGVHTNTGLFVGDTVLTSGYVDWVPVLKEMLLPVLLNDTVNPEKFIYQTHAYEAPRQSSIATDVNTQALLKAANAYFGSNESVFCGPTITLRSGTVITLASAATCVNQTTLLGGFVAGATVHPSPFPDAASCPAGRFPLFATAPLITMRCEQCPAGTYSAGGKQLQCLPCGTSKISVEGSAACHDPPSLLAVYIAMPLFAAVLMAVASVLGTLLYRSYQARRDLSFAPIDPNEPVTFVFTDIESSTALWAREPQAMSAVVDMHHNILRDLVREHRGYEVKTIGDAFMIAFKHVEDAVRFAVDAQRSLHDADWPFVSMIEDVYRDLHAEALMQLSTRVPPPDFEARSTHGLRVRIGVHTGKGQVAFDRIAKAYDYYGTVVNTAARVESVGHGGQVLVSDAVVRQLIGSAFDVVCPSAGTTQTVQLEHPRAALVLHSLGAHDLKGIKFPLPLFQLVDQNAPPCIAQRVFPPLRMQHASQDADVSIWNAQVLPSTMVHGGAGGGGAAGEGPGDTVVAVEKLASAFAHKNPFVARPSIHSESVSLPNTPRHRDRVVGTPVVSDCRGAAVRITSLGSSSGDGKSPLPTIADFSTGKCSRVLGDSNDGECASQYSHSDAGSQYSQSMGGLSRKIQTTAQSSATPDATMGHLMEAFQLVRTLLSPLTDAKRNDVIKLLAVAWRLKPPARQRGGLISDQFLMTIICRSAPVAFAKAKLTQPSAGTSMISDPSPRNPVSEEQIF